MNEILAIIPHGGPVGEEPVGFRRRVAGRPLVAHSVEQALTCPRISRVVVLTRDGKEEAEALQAGAEALPWQSDPVGESMGAQPALLSVLDALRTEHGYEPDAVVVLDVTTPQRRPEDLRRAIERFAEGNADVLFSASELRGSVWRREGAALSCLRLENTGEAQEPDSPVLLVDNGSFRIFRPAVLRMPGAGAMARTLAFVTSPGDSLRVGEPGGAAAVEAILSARERERAQAAMTGVALLVLDFDGVMTDNRVLVDQNGIEAVLCSRSDGWGISRLKKAEMEVVVLSTESNPVVQARCDKLGIPCVSGSADKLEHIRALAKERSLGASEVAFVGNDMNDVDAMGWVGIPIAVADACPEIRSLAVFVTTQPGGDGAVREVADWLLASREDEPEPG